MHELSGRTLVVVGGSQGMGRGAAEVAAARGMRVVIAGRSVEKLAAVRDAIDGDVRAEAIDVTDATSIEAFFSRVGDLDHLFVTASPGSSGSFLETPTDTVRSYMDGKFWGSYLCARHAAERMPAHGSITLLSGGLAVRPSPGASIVTAAFAAVEGLGRALAVELAPLRVNTIRPGTVDTPMWSFDSDEEREAFLTEARQVPARRVGQPRDIGHAVLFLMENSFVTGTVLEVNGGWQLV